MKRLLFCLYIALFLFCALACNKESDLPESGGKSRETWLTTSIEGKVKVEAAQSHLATTVRITITPLTNLLNNKNIIIVLFDSRGRVSKLDRVLYASHLHQGTWYCNLEIMKGATIKRMNILKYEEMF